jgi:hypothetical protein
MSHEARKLGYLGMIAITLLAAQSPLAVSGELETTPMQGGIAIRTLDDLVTLSAVQLDQLYRQSGPGQVPCGKVVGRALYPDSRFPKARSNAARIAWQGKVFDPESSTATNRFFGVKAIKGNLYVAPSWLDGCPSLILDYEHTSRIYGDYRDEIRQVAPSLYLGLMYDRTTAPPHLKMYFAFERQP